MNIKKAGDLVNKFKLVSVSQNIDIEREFDLVEHVSAVADSYINTMKNKGISLETDFPKKTMIYGDPGLISQVTICLFENTFLHAFDGIKHPKIQIGIQADSHHIRMTFEDNGIGMTEEVRKKAFDPFFTTKLGKGGSGLGLNIAHNIIVHGFQGRISINSSLGKGTEFNLEIGARRKDGFMENIGA